MHQEFVKQGVGMADKLNAGRPPAAAWMGYLGLLPFFAAALGLWVGPAWFAGVLLAYGAVILSFVGAIQWGLASSAADPRADAFYASVVPALVAWLALLLPAWLALPMLALGFVVWRIWEGLNGLSMPRWLRRLRTVLTIGAVISLLGGWLALLPITGKG